MIPILYKPDETDFTTNGLGRLSDCISCTVTEERNAVYEMDIEYPMDGVHFNDIENGSYIKAIPFYNGTPQIFFVYEISKPINGRCKIYCAHISYRLSYIPLAPFSATSAKDCFAKIKPNAMEDCPFTFWTDREIQKGYNLRYPDSIRGKLQGDQWSILQNYKPAEYEWDNFTVKMWTERGANKGVMLRYGKNIIDLRQEESIRSTVTGIVPYWFGTVGEEEELVMLPEKAIYTEYVDNFPYKRTGVVDLTDQWEDKPTVEQLRSRAQRYINENDIGIPRVSIKLNFVDLAQTAEYKDILPLQEINLCDTITVRFEKLGVNTQAKVTKTVWNVLLDRYDSIEIGAHSSNLATSIVEQNMSMSGTVDKTVINMTAALRQAQALINGGLGGYVVTNVNEDGQPEEIVIMDSPDIDTAVNCIRLNKNGIGFSQSGYSGPFNSAWTIDGRFNASYITTGTLNADLVKIINLIADTVVSQSSDKKLQTSIRGGFMTLARDDDDSGIYNQKLTTGVYPVQYTDGTIVYNGVVRLEGERYTSSTGEYQHLMSFLMPDELIVGSERGASDDATGTVRAGILDANTAIIYNGEQYRKYPIKGNGATYYALVTGTPTKTTGLTSLNSTAVTTIDSYVTVNMEGYSALLIGIRQTSGGALSWHVVPAGNWSNATFKFSDETNSMTINFTKTDTSIKVTLKSKTGTGGFQYIYGM